MSDYSCVLKCSGSFRDMVKGGHILLDRKYRGGGGEGGMQCKQWMCVQTCTAYTAEGGARIFQGG